MQSTWALGLFAAPCRWSLRSFAQACQHAANACLPRASSDTCPTRAPTDTCPQVEPPDPSLRKRMVRAAAQPHSLTAASAHLFPAVLLSAAAKAGMADPAVGGGGGRNGYGWLGSVHRAEGQGTGAWAGTSWCGEGPADGRKAEAPSHAAPRAFSSVGS